MPKLDTFIDLPGNAFPFDIPPADGQPGIGLCLPLPAQAASDSGIQQAERWLASEPCGFLWTQFVYGREGQPDGWRRTAFEIAFLTRLQQRMGRMPGELD
ncbi:LasR-specific antiactivator QslA [Pseudomonas citronellolis]|uniref:LasR-specific antiactivator QslA n=1 Tax=Pseudomonas citronellolis TaxID=53408 RepID=UPI0023E45824|nr:LasR-specific antiactivator QslA [Pseudomonas citronellolis]MDF3932896.1 LasR-specific antiactivator QslA [Pseudomonas citronellolis]